MEEGERAATAPPRPAPISPLLVAAMAAVQSWTDVPDNILVCVSAFLPCRADRVHMASVNRHWRAAAMGLQRPPPPLPVLPPQLPWLIFLGTEAPTCYSPLSRRYHRLPPYVRAARCCGSGDGGWLVLAFPAPHGHALYNLYSGDSISLPPRFMSPSDNTELPLAVLAATLSASPSQGPYVLASIALADNRPTAAFWIEGRHSWFSTGDSLLAMMPQDVIYHEGAFFFLAPNEHLTVFRTVQGPDGGVTLARVFHDMRQRADYDVDAQSILGLGRTKRYLVVEESTMLMVVRDVYYEAGTEMLRVFRLSASAVTNGRPPPFTWKEVFELNGQMLFVGLGCSRSFEVARYDGFQDQDSVIYFLDESFDAVPPLARSYNFTDMGRYSMEQLTCETWPPIPRPATSHDAPPTWWLH